MTTRITQLEGRVAGGRALLRVEGALGRADAELLVQVCTDLKAQTGASVTVDLTEISSLDGESASVKLPSVVWAIAGRATHRNMTDKATRRII